MPSLTSIILGGVQAIAGVFLLATGLGAGIGAKLLLSGVLTLVSSFMGAKTGRSGFASSPTYGWDNLGNAAFEGSPEQVVYGEHLVKPSPVSTNIVSSGQSQDLLALYHVSEGGADGIESISQVKVNDRSLSDFPNATTETRLGTSSQTAIPGFNEVGRQFDVSARLENGSAVTYEARGAADVLAIALVFPQGLWSSNRRGEPGDPASWTAKVEYRVHGSSASWAPFSPAADDGPTWRLDSGQAGTWQIIAASTSTYRATLRLRFDGASGRPSSGRYDIRVTGMGPTKAHYVNVPDWPSVVEISNDARTYAGSALLGLKLPASAQLGGSAPRVSCVVKGRKVYDTRTSTTAFSQNPAMIVRDLLVDTTYGLGLASSAIDTTSLEALANACDATVTPVTGGSAEKKWQLDYVLDVQSPAVDHLTQMLAGCRATLAYAGGKVYFVQDVARSVDRAFDASSTASTSGAGAVRDEGDGPDRRSTLVAKSLELSQRWNIVRVQYLDRNQEWRQRTIEVRDKYANIGAVTGGPFVVAEKIRGGTSKAEGILTAGYANGSAFVTYTQNDGATAFASGETITGATSGATAVLSSAPYSPSPERPLEIQLYGVTRRTQAIREARYALNNARSRTLFASWGGFLGDLDLLPGDRVTMTSDRPAWSARGFTILSMGFDEEGKATFECREYNADVFSDNVDTSSVDGLQYVPGGGVPPGLRYPAPSAPADPGSTANPQIPGGVFEGASSKGGVPKGTTGIQMGVPSLVKA